MSRDEGLVNCINKENITKLSTQEVNQLLASLTPVKFNYTSDDPNLTHAELIAGNVFNLVISIDHQFVQFGDIAAIPTKAAKDQQQMILALTRAPISSEKLSLP